MLVINLDTLNEARLNNPELSNIIKSLNEHMKDK